MTDGDSNGAGGSDAFSEAGSFAGPHEIIRRDAIPVAPGQATGSNTIRFPLVAIACWRVNDHMFDFDSSFLNPDMAPEIARLRDLVRANPGAPASVFGHADPTGTDDYNKSLSGRRARVIYGLLVHDVSIWEDIADHPLGKDNWGVRQVQLALSLVPSGDGTPFYAGPIDGAQTQATHDAVQSFQSANGLPTTGVAGGRTHHALWDAYMTALTDDGAGGTFKMTADQFIGAGADANGKGAYQGCSDFNPVLVFSQEEAQTFETDHATRDSRNRINRRVMVFLYQPGTVVSPDDWPCPRASEGASGCRAQFWPDADTRRKPQSDERRYRVTRNTMACRFYDSFARRSPCEGVVLTTVTVKLYDGALRPIPDAFYRMKIGGRVRVGQAIDAIAIARSVAVPNRCILEWNFVEDGELTSDGNETARFRTEVFFDFDEGSSEDQAKRRLSNIGYTRNTQFADNLKEFQSDQGLDATGTLDPTSEDRLRTEHDKLSPST